MKIILFLSNTILPLIIFYIVGMGLLQKRNVYEDFIKGAKDGFQTVLQIMPTLVGLLVAVGILRASGLLDAASNLLNNLVRLDFLPAEIIPVVVVRLFSNSAATGLVLDIFKKSGTDSPAGYMASILMSSTETVFYTMSLYYMSAGIKKTRWTLPGALLATAAGVVVSIFFGCHL